ncbi:MAG: T9SS type A sorting domain-containing protein [Flavobacteriales bacterium]|nr:T9SS type A sorting domain-containing protein [Flavobacteriales bacterium]
MRKLVIVVVFKLSATLVGAQCLDTLNFPNLQPPCYPDFVPVCGCDGVTYQNNCFAEFATVLQYIDGPCEQVAFTIYPNPTTDFLFTTIVTKYEADVNLYIFDRNGTIYYHTFLQAVTSEYLTIPMNVFDQGVYIIMVESNGVAKLSKFVKWNE